MAQFLSEVGGVGNAWENNLEKIFNTYNDV